MFKTMYEDLFHKKTKDDYVDAYYKLCELDKDFRGNIPPDEPYSSKAYRFSAEYAYIAGRLLLEQVNHLKTKRKLVLATLGLTFITLINAVSIVVYLSK